MQQATGQQDSYTWQGVVEFLMQKGRQAALVESERELEKHEWQEQVAVLQGKLKAQEALNADLLKRVKMLEVSLKQERMKFVAYLGKVNHSEREQILAQLKKSEGESLPQRIDLESSSSQKPDLELAKRRAKRQKNFLEKVLSEFDCTDILEEMRKFDEDNAHSEIRDFNTSSATSNPQKGTQSAQNTGNLEQVHRGKLHSHSVTGLVLTDDDKRLISCGSEGKLSLIGLDQLLSKGVEGSVVSSTKEEGYGLTAITSRGNTVFTGSTEGKVKSWELGKAGLIPGESTSLHRDAVTLLKVHNKENLLLSASIDGKIICSELRGTTLGDKTQAKNFSIGQNQTPSAICWHPDPRSQAFFVGVQEENIVYMFDQRSLRPTQVIKIDESKSSTASSARSKAIKQIATIAGNYSSLLVATQDGRVVLVDLSTYQPVQRFAVPGGSAVTSLSCSPDGHMFAAGSLDGAVRVWDIRRGEVVGEVFSHTRKFEEASSNLAFFSLGGKTALVSAGSEGEVVVYRIQSEY